MEPYRSPGRRLTDGLATLAEESFRLVEWLLVISAVLFLAEKTGKEALEWVARSLMVLQSMYLGSRTFAVYLTEAPGRTGRRHLRVILTALAIAMLVGFGYGWIGRLVASVA